MSLLKVLHSFGISGDVFPFLRFGPVLRVQRHPVPDNR